MLSLRCLIALQILRFEGILCVALHRRCVPTLPEKLLSKNINTTFTLGNEGPVSFLCRH